MHAIGHKLIYLMYTYSAAVYSVIQTKAGFKPLTYITEDRGLVGCGEYKSTFEVRDLYKLTACAQAYT